MLVLTRRPGESIVIGNGIKLTVVQVGPGRVKIGIEAPPSVRVDRAEVHARIQHEQASDVLATLGSVGGSNSADPATLVVAGPETDVLTEVVAQPTNPTPAPTPRLSQFRAPRKPR